MNAAKHPHIMPANDAAYDHAVGVLRSGGLVALPTETVYGLAADAANDAAVAAIYTAKGRPSHNPLIAHILRAGDAAALAEIPPLAGRLMDVFWPGPLTLVLPRKSGAKVSGLAGAQLSTIAIRCPDAPWASAFVARGFHGPIVMPSANRSGRISPTTAQHVFDDLGTRVDLIIDGGACAAGVESTVLAIEGEVATLLRPGTISADDLLPYISDLRLAKATAKPTAPGMLQSHYAPRAKVRLNVTSRRAGEVLLGFGDMAADANLSTRGDLAEAAARLYALLRALDRGDIDTIAVAPIPDIGIGQAVNDRLRRAAAERPESAEH